jgi:hypothetical protein
MLFLTLCGEWRTKSVDGFRLGVFEKGEDRVAVLGNFLPRCFVFFGRGEGDVAHLDIQIIIIAAIGDIAGNV